MAGSSFKKFRKNKIKNQMKDITASKVVANALATMGNMTDEEWDELAKGIAEELGLEMDKEKVEEAINKASEELANK